MPFSRAPRPCWGGALERRQRGGGRGFSAFSPPCEGGEPASHPAPGAAWSCCPGGSAGAPRCLPRCRCPRARRGPRSTACPPAPACSPACPGRCPAPWAPGRGRPCGGVGCGMLLLRCLLHGNASGGCCSPGAGWHGGSHPCGDSHTTDVTTLMGLPRALGGGGRSQPLECFSVGTAVGGCPMVCMWQASGAGVTRFAAGVLWSSRCFDVGVGFWHVPVFGYGLATGRCVAQEPGGEVGSVTGCTRPKILGGRVPVRGLPGGGTMPLLRGALRVGTHCHWCAMAVVRSWSFAWHKVSSVNSGVSSLGSAALMAFMPRCLLHWCRCETLLLHL